MCAGWRGAMVNVCQAIAKTPHRQWLDEIIPDAAPQRPSRQRLGMTFRDHDDRQRTVAPFCFRQRLQPALVGIVILKTNCPRQPFLDRGKHAGDSRDPLRAVTLRQAATQIRLTRTRPKIRPQNTARCHGPPFLARLALAQNAAGLMWQQLRDRECPSPPPKVVAFNIGIPVRGALHTSSPDLSLRHHHVHIREKHANHGHRRTRLPQS